MGWIQEITVTDGVTGDILDVLYCHDSACRNGALIERGIDTQTITDAEYAAYACERDGVRFEWGAVPYVEETETDTYCAGCGGLLARGMAWYATYDALRARSDALDEAHDLLDDLLLADDTGASALDEASAMFGATPERSARFDALETLYNEARAGIDAAFDDLGPED